MTTFTLDTSGFVEGPPQGVRTKRIYWPDLDTLDQDYVEALFASLQESTHTTGWAFRYLHPETLAAILRDCERFRLSYPGWRGSQFWKQRNVRGYFGTRFPPLTVNLGDDGKVYLRETAR